MEVQNSKAVDQLGVRFCSSNEQDLLMNQGKKDGYAAEDTEKNCETLLTEVLSLDDIDQIPNQQTQHFQISDIIPRNDNELSLEKLEKGKSFVDKYEKFDAPEKAKSFVDKYGVSDISKQGLNQISAQLLPRLTAVQMLYLQVTFL